MSRIVVQPILDKYDEDIAYLTANPEQIYDHWNELSPLFADCGYVGCGCLTQVRAGTWKAETPELTDEIKADKRIPNNPHFIKVSDLPVFAEWQRKIDILLGR